jgi:hypothetical protein
MGNCHQLSSMSFLATLERSLDQTGGSTYCFLRPQTVAVLERFMSDRFKSLIFITRQWMLSIVLVLAPIAVKEFCCCSRAAAKEVTCSDDCCQSSKSLGQSCCHRTAKGSRKSASDCDTCRTECQCRCGESTPVVPLAVRATVARTVKVLDAQLADVVLPIRNAVDEELPHAGDLRHDQLVIKQNRSQAILCVWRN